MISPQCVGNDTRDCGKCNACLRATIAKNSAEIEKLRGDLVLVTAERDGLVKEIAEMDPPCRHGSTGELISAESWRQRAESDRAAIAEAWSILTGWDAVRISNGSHEAARDPVGALTEAARAVVKERDHLRDETARLAKVVEDEKTRVKALDMLHENMMGANAKEVAALKTARDQRDVKLAFLVIVLYKVASMPTPGGALISQVLTQQERQRIAGNALKTMDAKVHALVEVIEAARYANADNVSPGLTDAFKKLDELGD